MARGLKKLSQGPAEDCRAGNLLQIIWNNGIAIPDISVSDDSE
jgi:hypothetical protein